MKIAAGGLRASIEDPQQVIANMQEVNQLMGDMDKIDAAFGMGTHWFSCSLVKFFIFCDFAMILESCARCDGFGIDVRIRFSRRCRRGCELRL
jgi:hypothetical protein